MFEAFGAKDHIIPGLWAILSLRVRVSGVWGFRVQGFRGWVRGFMLESKSKVGFSS